MDVLTIAILFGTLTIALIFAALPLLVIREKFLRNRRIIQLPRLGHLVWNPLSSGSQVLRQTISREQTLVVKHVVLTNFPLTPLEFFAFIGDQVEARQLPDVQQSLISRRQGGLLTRRRFYLNVSYRTSLCIVGATPFGTTLVISWRCGELPPWFQSVLVDHPALSSTVEWFLRPPTFYRIDLNNAFQQLIQQLIVSAIDQITEVRGMRPLNERQRQHILGMER